MIEAVVGLLMFVSGDLKEARIQENMAKCLRHRREAELESNIDGSKSIKKIIIK